MTSQPKCVAYFNTTESCGPELMEAVLIAENQEAAVLALFDKWAFMSPSQAWNIGCDFGRDWLLISVRRAISNLTKGGHLIKMDAYVEGMYNRRETIWIHANHPQGDLWGAK